MPTHFTHKNHYILVQVISCDSGLFVPLVDVGPEDGNHQVNMGTSLAFADEKAAEACGFELGREWIDKK